MPSSSTPSARSSRSRRSWISASRAASKKPRPMPLWLVTTHEPEAAGGQPPQALRGARDQLDLVGIREVVLLDDQRAVAIEQHEASRTHALGSRARRARSIRSGPACVQHAHACATRGAEVDWVARRGVRSRPRIGPGSVMRILVTGGAGFIGSHTVDALIARGHQVRILDSLEKPVHLHGKPAYLNPAAEFVLGDVTQPRGLGRGARGHRGRVPLRRLPGLPPGLQQVLPRERGGDGAALRAAGGAEAPRAQGRGGLLAGRLRRGPPPLPRRPRRLPGPAQRGAPARRTLRDPVPGGRRRDAVAADRRIRS